MNLIRTWRRKRLCQHPFPKAWEEIFTRSVPFVRRLPSKDRAELRDLVQVFLAEKVIEGCRGQQVTDEVRVVIAAHACLLSLKRTKDLYPFLGTVLVYPTSFAAPVAEVDDHGIVTEGLEERLGESCELGSVTLNWESALEVIEGRAGGLNVILHEFAHQIDCEEGISDGALLRQPDGDCQDWIALWQGAYTLERSHRRRGRPQVLDPYGAMSVTEFFAVATETFFEQSVRLKAHHPVLYAELAALFGQDPVADWR